MAWISPLGIHLSLTSDQNFLHCFFVVGAVVVQWETPTLHAESLRFHSFIHLYFFYKRLKVAQDNIPGKAGEDPLHLNPWRADGEMRTGGGKGVPFPSLTTSSMF